nr:NAD(P) transhydrogenase subunit alpha [Microlunatus panaciterrae]
MIAVARENQTGEARVALVPELVPKLITAGYEVAVQPGAGRGAMISDEEYTAAGALVTEDALSSAGLVISVQPLDPDRLGQLTAGAATVSFFPATQRLTEVVIRRELQLTSFAMESVPRISRAQTMDALSSQALVAGYRAAIVAAGRLRKFFGLSMTAAGTVPPAQVVVLGAGVAGLQAIATCRRLGAVVKGYDVRTAAAEEIRSMGGVAIELGLPPLEGAGGYAREMTEERALQQRELLTPYIAAADALITTAAVPGRQAPLLVTAAMVEQMQLGSVVVDLAADSGGNVEGSVPGGVVQIGGAQVWGGAGVPSQMPGPASRLYAQNVVNVIMLMTGERGFAPDFSDEIVASMCITHAGEVRHQPTLTLIAQLEDASHE